MRTTFIVGFPGETEEDFEELHNFVEETRFDRMGVFMYSKEEHTPAARYDEQVPEAAKLERYNRLMALQREVSLERNQACMGKTVDVLIDERAEEGNYNGRTAADAPEVDNEVLVTGDDLTPGDFVSVDITDALEYDLIGTVSTGMPSPGTKIERAFPAQFVTQVS